VNGTLAFSMTHARTTRSQAASRASLRTYSAATRRPAQSISRGEPSAVPSYTPKLYDGRNRTFFCGYYQNAATLDESGAVHHTDCGGTCAPTRTFPCWYES
jgi:hypothetical protein